MLFMVLFTSSVLAGVVIGGTRVIYPADKKTVSVSVMSDKTSGVYLVQSWIEPDVSGQKSAFIITPPLFRINPGGENLLRVVFTGGILPQDRESLFWLNVKSIPAIDDSALQDNTLQMVVKSRIKLFYRPSNLAGTPELCWQNLQVDYTDKRLTITNPGAYYVSFYSFKVDGKEYNDVSMIPPKGNISLSVEKASRVSWQAINDYGGIVPAVHHQL
ncbi:MAG: molecular chaperone [Pluralibacter sp.]|nr:molecular chaperone [Pluralibacter sp.]